MGDVERARLRCRHPDADISEMAAEEIEEHARRQYLDADPWPFDALA